MRFRPSEAPGPLSNALQQAEFEFGTVERFLASQAASTSSLARDEQPDDDTVGLSKLLLQWIDAEVAPPMVSGLQLYYTLRDTRRLLPTGCESFDALMHGGLREGQHTEVYGESGSGKTQLSLLAALNTAMRGEGVAYVDTGNSFSAGRLAAMHGCVQATATQPGPPLDAVLARVHVTRCYHVHGLLEWLDELALSLAAHEQHQQHQQQGGQGTGGLHGAGPGGGGGGGGVGDGQGSRLVSLVVIDSLGGLLAPVLGGKVQGRGHALMLCVARTLRLLAERYSLAVLSSNQQVGGSRGEPRPALGDSWRNQPHWRIQLAKAGTQGRRCATVKSCPIAAAERQVHFVLADAGPS